MERSIPTIRDAAAVVRGRRKDLGLSQAEVARRARVSRQWVVEFEAGKATAELGLVIRLFGALALELSVTERPSGDEPRPSELVDLDELLNRHRRG